MKPNIIDYISKLESYKTAIKNYHWSSSCMSEHRLMDDIASSVSDNQDEVAEISQGLFGQINKNELKPTKYEISDSRKLLEDIISDTKNFYKTIDGDIFIGLRSVIEAFLGDLNKFQYLLTLCLKEDVKSRLKNKLNESRFFL